MDIIDNGSYHRLLLTYKGVEAADTLMGAVKEEGLDGATIGYGVANRHLYCGRRDQALGMLREIVEKHASTWAAFRYIAAEAELARLGKSRQQSDLSLISV